MLKHISVVTSALTSATLALTATVALTGAGSAATGSAPAPSTVTTADLSLAKATTRRTVLKSAAFDSLPTGRISAANFQRTLGGSNSSEYYYDDSYIAADSRGTGKVYRLKLDRNTIRDNPSGNHGVVVFIPLPKQVENACIAYQIRFDPNFDWSLGGKLPGLQGTAPGVSPSLPTGGGKPGDKGWSGRMMWLTPKSYSWAGPGNMSVSYMYGPRQSSTYGDNIRWNRGFTAGRWHTVKQCYRMNTVGQANGVLRAWIDGTRVLDITNYVYRLRNDVKISHLNWSIFRGGGTLDWAGSRDSYIDVDKLRVTTRS